MGASASGPGAIACGDGAQEVSAHSGDDPLRVCAEAFHPSEYIKDGLAARGWDECDLAVRMGGDLMHNRLMLDMYFIVGPTQRNCRIGDVMAHQLGVAFDVSHQFFLNLEAAWLAHPSTADLVCDSDRSDDATAQPPQISSTIPHREGE